MPRFFLALSGASKHDAPLLQPCGSEQFSYDPSRDEYVLDGGEISMERFNELTPELIRKWPPLSQYRLVPKVERDPEEADAQERIASLERTIEELKRKRKLTPEPVPA